jgi:hypothetical protein
MEGGWRIEGSGGDMWLGERYVEDTFEVNSANVQHGLDHLAYLPVPGARRPVVITRQLHFEIDNATGSGGPSCNRRSPEVGQMNGTS